MFICINIYVHMYVACLSRDGYTEKHPSSGGNIDGTITSGGRGGFDRSGPDKRTSFPSAALHREAKRSFASNYNSKLIP